MTRRPPPLRIPQVESAIAAKTAAPGGPFTDADVLNFLANTECLEVCARVCVLLCARHVAWRGQLLFMHTSLPAPVHLCITMDVRTAAVMPLTGDQRHQLRVLLMRGFTR